MASLTKRRKELLDSMMKEAVYEGAVAVLTQDGLKGLTMDRVAAASGMAKGSLYNHFHGKQKLLEFVHDRAVAPLHEELDKIVNCGGTAAEKLRTISQLWREYLVEHHAVFEFFINDNETKKLVHNSERTMRSSGINQIATIIERGIHEGEIRQVDAMAVAEMFVSASIGMVEQEFATGTSRPVDEAVDALMGVFLYGLRATEGEGSEK